MQEKFTLNTALYINAYASISALGATEKEVWKSYQNPHAFFTKKNFTNSVEKGSFLSAKSKQKINALQAENARYKQLDPSVAYAVFVNRELQKKLNWDTQDIGINLGSSRGATSLFEEYHQQFINTGKAPALSSPTTTLGNISSWIAQDLGSNGPVISHSITCSTALHSILNAAAWIRSGMATHFFAGGTEAPLTDFTLAQMKSLKLYSTDENDFPCRSLDFKKEKNTLILGEAAASFAISTHAEAALAKIAGLGYATEMIMHNISISSDATCFQSSMKMALKDAQIDSVDAIVMHAPGTIKGDLAEFKAIEKTFSKLPFLTTNKWKIGHSFGASGAMSLEMALLMLEHQQWIKNPFYTMNDARGEINSVMVNAVGFGGNAVSIILSKI
ncbi:MAG: beta-ketoacyl synthase N-terminal-like domain-containing protein [Bacteroidota bacterium]